MRIPPAQRVGTQRELRDGPLVVHSEAPIGPEPGGAEAHARPRRTGGPPGSRSPGSRAPGRSWLRSARAGSRRLSGLRAHWAGSLLAEDPRQQGDSRWASLRRFSMERMRSCRSIPPAGPRGSPAGPRSPQTWTPRLREKKTRIATSAPRSRVCIVIAARTLPRRVACRRSGAPSPRAESCSPGPARWPPGSRARGSPTSRASP